MSVGPRTLQVGFLDCSSQKSIFVQLRTNKNVKSGGGGGKEGGRFSGVQ